MPTVQDVTLYEVFPGRVEARDSVRIVARVPGVLQDIHFEDGQEVKAGDALFTIEPDSYQAALKAAQAQLAQAKAGESLATASLMRKKKAFEVRAVSELDVLSAEADLEAAKAALDASEAAVAQAELNLSYTEITAPMDGVMSKASVSTGNLVGPGAVTELALLVRVDVANVVFSMDERRLLPKLRMLAEREDRRERVLPPVGLELADGQLYGLEGRLDYIDNVIDAATGTLQVRAVFENPDQLLVDGMFARVRIPVPVTAAMQVPETAILRDLVGPYVYILDGESKVEQAYVTLGPLMEGRRIIEGGLMKDARVVVKGIQQVRPGVAVTTDGGA
jgi:RND family efflux transporter MFP subunit